MRYYLLSLFVGLCLISKSETIRASIVYLDSSQTVISQEIVSIDSKRPNPIFLLFKKKQRLNKRITAAVLSFPFPFGIVGLHRIYLGTNPHVPVVYIATLGGIFGLLPLMDFIAITFGNDFETYRNNGNVFMWVKD
jgi:TM2 domain-containing membrane protein YozV